MTDRARALIVSVMLAMLVWVFAEAESLRSEDTSIEMIFESERRAERVIDITDPRRNEPYPAGTPITISLSIDGSTAALDSFFRRGGGRTIRFSPGSGRIPNTPGEHALDVREALREHPLFEDSGITIKKVEPQTLRLVVDEVVAREVRVEVVTPIGDLDGLPEAQPGLVRVVAPAREAALLTDESAAVLRVDDGTWSRLVPGRRETIPGVRLELPTELAGSSRARLEPASADVLLTVRSRTASIVLPSVPVHLRVAPAELGRFNIEIAEQDRSIIDVTVSGPAELVRQVADKTLPIIAFVPLSFEELERGIPGKDAQFTNVPGGALRFEAARRNVRLTITRREVAAPVSPPISAPR